MTNLEQAISYIESKVERRAAGQRGATVLDSDEANHVLALLKTHAAQEQAIQLDIEMERRFQ